MTKVWDIFWISAFQTEFVPELNAIVDVLERRLLPNLEEDSIKEESDRIRAEDLKRFESMPSTGDKDPSVFCEAAEEVGPAHYILMNGIRQGILNLFTIMLFHVFEQQIIYFHRKNVLPQCEKNKPEQFKLSVFRCRLKEYGIDIKSFSSWPKIDELRLVANTVKHAEGGSSQQLREKRPDMFRNPHLLGYSQFISDPAPHVSQPLVGDDLYVSIQDIKDYRDHLVGFWQELADDMQCA